MNKAEFLDKLDKAGGRREEKQKGKWRLVHDGVTVIYFGSADCLTHTPKTNTIEHFNTEKKGLARIKELGLTEI